MQRFRASGFGFRVQEFRVQGLGCRVNSRLMDYGLWFKVYGLGPMVDGLGFLVQGVSGGFHREAHTENPPAFGPK